MPFTYFGGVANGGSAGVATQGNGMVMHNGGQQVGRALIQRGGATIVHPDGIGGNPVIAVHGMAGRLNFPARVNLHLADDQPIIMRPLGDRYIITSVVFSNVLGDPGSASGGVYTLEAQAGRAIVASHAFSALAGDDPLKTDVVAVSVAYRLRCGVLYLTLDDLADDDCFVDVYVLGYALDDIVA